MNAKTGQSLDQKRAEYAWKCVQGQPTEYVNLAKGAGALIMSNGLMATLAFYEDKNKEHHKSLSTHIIDWLCEYGIVDDKSFAGCMTGLYSSDSATYRQATQESLDLLRWIRHFAAAVNTLKIKG